MSGENLTSDQFLEHVSTYLASRQAEKGKERVRIISVAQSG